MLTSEDILSYKNEREYREYRETSRERSRDRRERGRSREHRIIPSHYIEQIPVPVYYGVSILFIFNYEKKYLKNIKFY